MRQVETGRRWGDIGIIGASVFVLCMGFLLDVRGREVVLSDRALPSPCFVHNSGLGDCPGCGLTRSVVSWCHGRCGEGWAWHPGGIFIVALVVVQIPYRTACLARNAWRTRAAWAAAVSRVLLLSVLAIGILRWGAHGILAAVGG